jgi:hypothetical protein
VVVVDSLVVDVGGSVVLVGADVDVVDADELVVLLERGPVVVVVEPRGVDARRRVS